MTMRGDGDPSALLAGAVLAGDAVAAERALAAGADPDSIVPCSGDLSCALTVAARSGDAEMAELLLRWGAAPDGVGLGTPPVAGTVEARMGMGAAVVVLLAGHGADLDAEGDVGRTALLDAALYDYPELAKALVECGADPHRPCDSGVSPLDVAMDGTACAIREAMALREARREVAEISAECHCGLGGGGRRRL